MLIHSIAPIEYLMGPAAPSNSVCRTYGSRVLQGHETPQGFVLERVISTDPADYLRADWSPGSLLPRP